MMEMIATMREMIVPKTEILPIFSDSSLLIMDTRRKQRHRT